MKQRKAALALGLALVMLLMPALALAGTYNLTLSVGSIVVSSTGYEQGTTNQSFGEDTAPVVNISPGTTGTTDNKITLNNTGSTSVNITGEITYTGTGSFLTASGDVDNLTLKETTITAGSGPAISVADGADVEMKMENANVVAGTSGPAIQVNGDLNIAASGTGNVYGSNEDPALDIGASGKVTVSGGTLDLTSNNASGTVSGDSTGTLTVQEGTVNVVNRNTTSTQPVQGVTVNGSSSTTSGAIDGSPVNTTTITPAGSVSGVSDATPTMVITLNGDPNDIAADIPLGNLDSDNLSINGVNFVPDITPGNCVRLEGGDALMATLVNDDPQFFEGLEVGEPPIKENIFIRHGNAYLSLSDGPHVNLYEQAAKSTIRLLKKSMEEKGQSGNEDWNFSNYQAMKLLEGQKYSIKADGQPLVDIIIGSVVEVPPTPTVWQDDLTPPPYHDPSYDKVGEATNVCPHGRPIGQCEIPPCAPLVNP